MKCLNCKSSDFRKLIDLTDQPSGNIYFSSKESSVNAERLPLAYSYCNDCGLVQLDQFPDFSKLFDAHNYLTGTSKPVVDHFESLSESLESFVSLKKGDLVMDIGSNDGTFLKNFLDRQYRVIGIDPGVYARPFAEKSGVTTFRSYWTDALARQLKDFELSPKLITAASVFYHIPDIDDFVAGLLTICDSDSYVAIQYVSLEEMLRNCTFDHLYHEHSMMYSNATLVDVFERRGFIHLSSTLYPIHGGSYVSIFKGSQLQGGKSKSHVFELDRSIYDSFFTRAEQIKLKLREFLNEISIRKNKRVFGVGAAVKASTLINYLEIDSTLIQCVLEINPLKVGKYIPGTDIEIIHEDNCELSADFLFIFSWNFKDYFIEKYASFLNQGGTLIFPHPRPHTVTKSGTQWL